MTFDPSGLRDKPPQPRSARQLWVVAIVLLALATVAAAVLVGRSLIPVAARAAGDAAGGIADASGWAMDEAGDAWQRWTHRLEDIAEASPVTPGTVPAPPGSASLLLVAVDDQGHGAGFALLAESPAGSVAVVLVPPGLLAVQPGFGDFPLADALVFEGPDLASLTLTNLLGIRIDDVLVLRPGDLEAALEGDVVVDLPVPLIVAEGDSGTVLAKSGKVQRSSRTLQTLLTVQGQGDELEWLQRQGAVWDGLLDAIAADDAIARRLAEFGGDRSEAERLLLAAAVASDRTVTVIPVTRVSVGATASGFTLDGDAATGFLSQRIGHLLLREGDRPRVELLNGNGRIGTTRVVARELVRRGFRVIKTDNADAFDYERSQVIAQGRENRTEAEAVLDLLGTGELLLEVRSPSGVVDITVIVGQDVPVGEG